MSDLCLVFRLRPPPPIRHRIESRNQEQGAHGARFYPDRACKRNRCGRNQFVVDRAPMAVHPSSSLSQEIASGIARVRRRMIGEADRRLGQHGETVVAWQVLSALQRSGPSAQNELAQHIGQHPTGMSRLLEELEQARLVRRSRDRSDRRKVLVVPTARGRNFLEQRRPLVDAAVEEVLAPLARAERRTLRDLLWRMLER